MSVTPVTTNLLAAAVPAPNLPGAPLAVATAFTGTRQSFIAQGVATAERTKLCKNTLGDAALLETFGMWGGNGVHGFAYGVTPSALTTALTLNFTPGQAQIGLPVQILAGINDSHPLPISQAHIYVWLLQNGTWTDTATTTPPAGAVLYCCHCSTDSSGVTSIDLAGRVTFEAGVAVRSTGDAGGPADSPSSQIVVMTKTAFCSYLWDGASHRQIGIPSVASDPASPVAGDMWFNTVSLKLSTYTGGAIKRTAAFT